MSISLIDSQNIECKLCGKQFNRRCTLSGHLKRDHDIDAMVYTIKHLLGNTIPVCACGCGKLVKVYNYRYNEYCIGHTGGGLWQDKFNKDSSEYIEICNKISKSVKRYQAAHPVTFTPERNEKLKKSLAEYKQNNPDKVKAASEKMAATKRKQSTNGLLSANHYTKTKSIEDVSDIYKRLIEKATATKKVRYATGELTAWNKGLNKYIDERVRNNAGENHYLFNPTKDVPYDDKFRNKIYREFILKTQGGKCALCQSNTKLCLHHIDEDKQNSEFSNLIYVCRSHHAQVHFNKEYQKTANIIFCNLKNDIISEYLAENLEDYFFTNKYKGFIIHGVS